MSAISLHNIIVERDEHVVIHGLHAEIPVGSFTVFIGDSGCGKTTILELCSRNLLPTQGEVMFSTPKVKIAFMRQSSETPPKMKTFDYIAHGLLQQANWFRRVLNKPSFANHVRIMDYLEKVNLLHLKDRKFEKLSGGERRRIEVANTIIQEADIYIFDEPITGLDRQTAEIILNEIAALQRNQNKTVICTTSQADIVSRYATHMIVNHDGNWLDAHFPG